MVQQHPLPVSRLSGNYCTKQPSRARALVAIGSLSTVETMYLLASDWVASDAAPC